MALPFVQVSGRWHVIVDWKPDMGSSSRLHLRVLSQAEAKWLEDQLEDAMFEIWARLFPTDHSVTNGGVITEEDDG